MVVLFAFCIQVLKPPSFEIRDQIEGFKLYLKTDESERLKFVSTPPTKTPQLSIQLLK